MRDAALGLGLTVVLSALVWMVWGGQVVVATATVGVLATVIHLAGVALLKPALVPPFERLVVRWAWGLGFRVAGVGLVGVAMLLDGTRFPALPTAIGFVGVLLPLMFTEMRLLLVAIRSGR